MPLTNVIQPSPFRSFKFSLPLPFLYWPNSLVMRPLRLSFGSHFKKKEKRHDFGRGKNSNLTGLNLASKTNLRSRNFGTEWRGSTPSPQKSPNHTHPQRGEKKKEKERRGERNRKKNQILNDLEIMWIFLSIYLASLGRKQKKGVRRHGNLKGKGKKICNTDLLA